MDPAEVEFYYRKQTTARTSQRRLRREYGIVRRLLGPLAAGALVLDAPCGIGPHTRRLQAEGLRVLALDLNPHMLRHAVEDTRPTHAVRADARALPLRDDAVDAAVVIRLMHYLDDPAERRALLGEMRRVSRGRVVISFMHPVAVAPLLRARPTRKTQTLATIRADAAASGLRLVRLRPVLPFVKRMWFAALERA